MTSIKIVVIGILLLVLASMYRKLDGDMLELHLAGHVFVWLVLMSLLVAAGYVLAL